MSDADPLRKPEPPHPEPDAESGQGELLPAAGPRGGSSASGGPDGYGGHGRAGGYGDPFQADPFQAYETGDVGEFRRGNAETSWALARYLVGRVILVKVSIGLLFTAALIAALGIAVYALGVEWLGVLILLVALGFVVVRWVFATIVRRMTAAAQFGPAEAQVKQLLGDTSGDLRRELRRVGLPSGWWSFPLLLLRLMRSKSRRKLFARMRTIELERIVPPSRVDQLHMAIDAARRG